ncbi:MAG TPA: SCP2 sterol-binding domain-containing protein [Solirubrobacteraceae bacterium]|nr:SCP2 sterol-binding domain-containing protein [Solirubrobacteraceae bacterium]
MIWFDRRSARGLTATLELRVRVLPRRRGTPVTLQIEDGRLRIRPGAAPSAGATATVGLADLVRLGAGTAAWPQLMSNGRLELSGDPFLALRFPTLFRLPAARRWSGFPPPDGARRRRHRPDGAAGERAAGI